MKKIIIILIAALVPTIAWADIILLRNGSIVEGKIVQVRGIFVRVLGNNDTPFREFLIEDIVNIEQSAPDEVSQLTIRNIHQRALNRASSGKIEAAVTKKAAELLEEALQKSETATLDNASAGIKSEARKKASAIIGEAVKTAGTQRLDDLPAEVKNIAEQKAGTVIEEAVKTVEMFPLKRAPDNVQIAAKKAATTLVEEAFSGTSPQSRAFTILGFTLKDFFFAGLIILLITMLFREKQKNGNGQAQESAEFDSATDKPERKAASEDIEVREQLAPAMSIAEDRSTDWEEKRGDKRFEWNFPISLSLDENNPIFAMVKNISRSGAYAICNDVNLLRVLGDESRFKFNFASKDPNFPINGKAEIVRIRSNRGLGLKFFDMNQESIGYLDNLAATS